MSKYILEKYHPNTFQETFAYAIKHKLLDEYKTSLYLKQIEDGITTLILSYNYGRSSVVTQSVYKEICDSFFFALDHALEDKESITLIQECDVDTLYVLGQVVIDEQIDNIEALYFKIKAYDLPFYNERYLDVINKQLLYFYTSYDKDYNALYYYEDFDYPLIDGIALYQNMYDLQSVDFVFTYAKRFFLEQRFCAMFQKEDIRVFIEAYEYHHNISTQYIGCNLSTMLFTQAALSLCIQNTPTLLLQADQIELINQQSINVIQQALRNYEQAIPDTEVREYIKKYNSDVKTQIMCAQKGGYLKNLLVDIQTTNTKQTLHLSHNLSSTQFQEIELILLNEKDNTKLLALLKDTNLGVYDYIDIFNLDIVNKELYIMLFSSWNMYELAIILKLSFREIFAFDKLDDINTLHEHEADIESQWQSLLFQYVLDLEKDKQEELLQYIYQIYID